MSDTLTLPGDIPCRCGYSGEGIHRCHAGRPDPRTGEDGSRWCELPGVVRVFAVESSLAGMQLKFGAVVGCYCAAHWRAVEGAP